MTNVNHVNVWMIYNRKPFKKLFVVIGLLFFMLTAMSPTPLLASTELNNQPQPLAWYTIHSNSISVAFWTGIEPHYGAFFTGSSGYNQYYTGSESTCISSAGCIGGWTWWGGSNNVLLIPKGGWLTCLWCRERWNAGNYWATLWI